MKKKILLSILVLLFGFSLIGCNNKTEDEELDNNNTEEVEEFDEEDEVEEYDEYFDEEYEDEE